MNPSVTVKAAAPTPSVVDLVNPALKKTEGEPVYTSVSDPGQRGSEAATSPKDWTIHRPAPQMVETPPAKPVGQVLLENLKSLWTISASAVQLEQVKDQVTPPQTPVPGEMPGIFAKEVLTYSPSKVKKNEKI